MFLLKFGGAGAGYAELAVVLHELGRAIVPSPFLASAVLATGALSMSDNEPLASGLLAAMTGGQSLGSAALASLDGSYELKRATVEWERAGESIRLQGAAGFVLDADVADVLVVAAVDSDECPVIVAVDRAIRGVRVEQAATVDATRRLFTVFFDDVVVADDQLLCEPGVAAEELYDRIVAIGVIAAACDATGVTEQALERAAEYAKERVQFGKPIGSFQAVKHHCANMAIAVEASRAAVRGAAKALDGDPRNWSTTASVTSSYVGPACRGGVHARVADLRRDRVHVGARVAPVPEARQARRADVRYTVVAPSSPRVHTDRACTLIESGNERG